MGAYLLIGFCCSKNPNHRNFRFLVDLRRLDIASKERIKSCRRCLIMVDAIQAYTEEIHRELSLVNDIIVHEIRVLRYFFCFGFATRLMKRDSNTVSRESRRTLRETFRCVIILGYA